MQTADTSPPSRRRRRARFAGIAALVTASAGILLFQIRSGPAGDGTLNVDNSSADAWEVWLDGGHAGGVKPFEVGVFRRRPGTHEVRVTAGGRELDSAHVQLKLGETTVFNPGGRASYIREWASFASGFVMHRCPVGEPVHVVSGQNVIQVDLGPASKFPLKLEANRSACLTRLIRVPPTAFDPATAAGFIRAPRKLYDYRPQSYVEAVRAILKAVPSADGVEAVCLALESDDSYIVQHGFMAAWQAGAILPEARLIKWMDRPPTGDDSAPRLRRAHAFLLLLSRGKGDLVRSRCDKRVPDFEGYIARHLQLLPASAYEPLLRESARLGHTGLSMMAIYGALGAEAALDAQVAVLLDALIEKLEPSDRKWRVRLWAERLASGKDRLDPSYVGQRLLSALREGCLERPLIDAIVRMGLGADMASGYARMKSYDRFLLLVRLNDRVAGDALETEAQLAVLEAALRDPDPSWRHHSLKCLDEMHQRLRDDRVPGILLRAGEQETELEWKRRFLGRRAFLIR